jgi:poly(3-hydroxybutyrate) depolymerase
VTDWKNARDIPFWAGTFDLDDYVDYLMTYLRTLGRGANILAVCQAAVPALVAVSLMAQDNESEQPATLTMLAGPIDPRVNPTQVNEFAVSHSLGQFRTSTINFVPWPLPGMGRAVYPGFRQVGGFMSMNMEHHLGKHKEHYQALVRGDDTKDTSPHRVFYDEYCSVMDLTAEFYLDTVERVFQQFHLPQGQFYWRGRLVEPNAISQSAVLAIEGGADDITGVSQTKAALTLLTGLAKAKQGYHLEKKAGHYGVFSGSRFKTTIEPTIRNFILCHNSEDT